MIDKVEAEEIRSRYPGVYFPNPIMEPVWFGKRPNSKIEGKKAIIDQNNGAFFAICSEEYKIVRFEEVIKTVEIAAKEYPEFGDPIIYPRVINGGSKIIVHCNFPKQNFEIKVGDLVSPGFYLRSSLDLDWKLLEVYEAKRLVCSNGMVVGERISSYKKRHIQSLNLDEVTDKIKEGLSHFSEQTGLWRKYVEIQLNDEIYNGVWNKLPFSKTEREKIEAVPEVATKLSLTDMRRDKNLTLWGLNSVLTQYTTHNITNDLKRAEIEPIIARVLESQVV